MTDWLGLILDVILIAVVGMGTVQATRLIRQLKDLRASRSEMDRFVRDFNSAVMRAEAGIKSLRAAARESGDDLEKLVEKAVMVRDELNFIVESADGVAERLSVSASQVLHTEHAQTNKNQNDVKHFEQQSSPRATTVAPPQAPAETVPSSRAEKELMQALQKMK
jgi:hypothetical protein